MKLFWENEVGGDTTQHYILKRQTLTLRPFISAHTHDYAELIYVERGSAIHQVNNVNTRVGKGDVLFIYPDTVAHCYLDIDKSFSLLQILFPKESFRFITQRYNESVHELLGEMNNSRLVNLGPMQQIWFERNFDSLLVNTRTLIEIERFLLNFICMIRETNNMCGNGSSTGQWLDRALREIQEPRNFIKGTKGFVDLCNHSAEHVEREVKKRTGRTVTDVVNQARMSWASYMLIFSNANIFDISYGCGLDSISYFYKLFHEHFRISPGKYRKQASVSSENTFSNPFSLY